MEVHEPDSGIRRLQDVAITPAKRGAGDDLISFGLVDPLADSPQPGRPVAVG
jgi:hypothetical protein